MIRFNALSTLLITTMMLLTTACGPDERVRTIVSLTGDVTAGKTLFEGNCLGCHGASGTGGSYQVNITNVNDDEKVADIVLSGDGDMPAFDSWSDQEVADVVAYVKSL